MASIHQVDPNKILLWEGEQMPSTGEVMYQRARLESEGQIEPLVADPQGDGTWVVDNIDWPYQMAQVVAARELQWPTLLVTEESGE